MLNKIGDDTGVSKADLFISDLHLCQDRPHITQAFLAFLKSTATQARALYILGDLFEYWAGDDDMASHQPIVEGLRQLADGGVKLYLMHGNRDFLIGHEFCTAAGLTLLADPCLINLHGQTTLISHGDALCSDDVDYQAFRLQVREKKWQNDFLQQPLATRKAQITSMRARSEQEKSHKASAIMDVNPLALKQLLQEQHYPKLFIHGHTHRPQRQELSLDGHAITRWVLGDWYEQGGYLSCDALGCKSHTLK